VAQVRSKSISFCLRHPKGLHRLVIVLGGNCSALNHKERKDHKERQKASNLCALRAFFVVFVVKSRLA
jgi:hypothetical protein